MLSRMRILRSKRVGELLRSFIHHRFLCTNLTPPADAASLRPRSFLKYAAVSALTGATAFTAYVSYAYSSDEIEEKTKSIRESAKYTAFGAGDNGSTTLGKFQAKLYSTALTGPTKAIELYLEKRRLIEGIIRSYTEPWRDKLLPDLPPGEGEHVYTLVLDLYETLIYEEWMRLQRREAAKRPGVVDFLKHLSRFYEIVVYTDEENSVYVKRVIKRLDPTEKCIRYCLSRVATKYQDGKHFRDLSKLNRDPAKVIYLSGHALENCLQPENCIPIKPCKGFDKDDTTLLDFIPFLKYVALQSPTDIRSVLQSYRGCDIPTEFIKRSTEVKRLQPFRQMIGGLW